MNESREFYESALEENHEILDKFQEWILTQPHLPKNIPRITLLHYFKVCHCDLEEVKNLLDINVKFRIKHQHLFADRDIDSKEFQRALNTAPIIGGLKLTNEKKDIMIYRLANFDADNFILNDILKAIFLSSDLIWHCVPYTEGTIGIFDAQGFSFSHFMKFVSNFKGVSIFTQYGQEAAFTDTIQTHVVNCSPIIMKLWNFVKHFLNEHVTENTFFHCNRFETLHEHIDKECLPVEYGGSCGTLDDFSKSLLDFQMNESIEIYESHLEENREILNTFQEWILTQPHLPKNIPKAVLLRYFKVCNFDLEEAKKLLNINVKFRIENQYLFADRDIDSKDFQKALNTGQVLGGLKLTKDKYDIIIYRLADYDTSNFILNDILKVVFTLVDMIWFCVPYTEGNVGIFDAQGLSFSLFMKFVSNIKSVSLFIQYGQEAAFSDAKQFHVVNCSPIVPKVFNFLKHFLNKHVTENTFFHCNGFETLHEHIDKECLPIEYGGSCGTLDDFSKVNIDNLYKHREFVTKNENFFLLNKK